MGTLETAIKGLAKVKDIYRHREKRAQELRAEGKKIIGYFCCYPPLEVFTAAGLVPYRIFGDIREPISQADAYLETQTCAFVRSCFDIAIKGRYDFLDGFVVPHSCDPIYFIYRIWKYHLKPPFSHFIQIPHVPHHATSVAFFRRELERLQRSVESVVGRTLASSQLKEAIREHNRNRALLRKLNQLRKETPPGISGSEMMQTVLAVMSLPVNESNELLENLLTGMKARPRADDRSQARVLVYGSEMDDIAFMELVERSGANVVIDDLAVGTRFYWHDVENREDPLEALAERYLLKIKCPRTYWEGKPEKRFAYIMDYVNDFGVNGVILYTHRFCDSHGLDVPDLRDYLREQGVPVIHLEDDYSMSSLAPLQVRVQAFVEMLS